MFRLLERLLALTGLAGVVLSGLLLQTTGTSTPCQAVAVRSQTHLDDAAARVVDACLGAKGEGGLGGFVLELGLAVAGQSRQKIQASTRQRLELNLRANLLGASQTRCLVILAEDVVGRSNGGTTDLVRDLAQESVAACQPARTGK